MDRRFFHTLKRTRTREWRVLPELQNHVVGRLKKVGHTDSARSRCWVLLFHVSGASLVSRASSLKTSTAELIQQVLPNAFEICEVADL